MGLFDDAWAAPQRSASQRKRLQLSKPVFTKPDGWQPHDDLPELSGYVAFDSENKDLGIAAGGGSCWAHKGVGFNCGYAFSWERGDFYLPIRHGDGNIDPDRVHRWLKAQAAKPDVTFVYANCVHDLGWLWREGIEPANPPIDVQGMASLLDEFKLSYSLDSLGWEYLRRGKGDDEFYAACAAGGLHSPKDNMDLVPGWIAEAYGLSDSRLTYDLFKTLAPKIIQEGLTQIHELERECYLVGFDMKRQGTPVNVDKASRYMEIFERKRDESLGFVYRETGVRCAATDNAALARALRVENPALELPKTEQGHDSIRKDFIETLRSPVADAINTARRYDKAVGTFLKGYILEGSANGRIHADFNPLRQSDPDKARGGMKGASTGRWSSTDPNLTNIPNRDPEIGHAVRDCFEAEAGEEWGKLDYSAQEPRIGVHVAEKARIQGAKEMADLYRANPRFDMHQEVGTAMNTSRRNAKTINLAIWYGAGGAEICDRLGLPTEMKTSRYTGKEYRAAGPEGQALINTHMRRFPFIKKLQEATKAKADERGWVQTVWKRKCRFKRFGDEYARTYKACNSVIQGSAADQMKLAQVAMRREGIIPLVVVHDECDVSIPRGDAGVRLVERIKAIMEAAMPLTVPVVADVKIGANWAGVRD